MSVVCQALAFLFVFTVLGQSGTVRYDYQPTAVHQEQP